MSKTEKTVIALSVGALVIYLLTRKQPLTINGMGAEAIRLDGWGDDGLGVIRGRRSCPPGYAMSHMGSRCIPRAQAAAGY